MFTKENISKKRCDKCKRRKKKCVIIGDSCQYCIQKKIACSFSAQRLSYNPQNGRICKAEISRKKVETCTQELVLSNLIRPQNTCQLSFPLETKFSFTSRSFHKLFLPLHNSFIKSDKIIMVNEDKVPVDIYNKDMVIFHNFSLPSYVLSSVRIKQIEDLYDIDQDISALVKMANSNLRYELQNFFRKNHIRISEKKTDNMDNSIDSHCCESIPDHKTPEQINLKINVSKLKNVLMIEKAAITMGQGNLRFADLPSFITPDLADYLFNHFCTSCIDGFFIFSNSNSSMLHVCLPLILGNSTVLKTVFLYSYFHTLHINNEDQQLKMLLPKMKKMYHSLIMDLDNRLSYYSSVSCDHSIICVYLLLNIEVVNGGRGLLWNKFQILIQQMISLRGGVKEMIQTLTGECLLKLLVPFCCTEVNLENNTTSLGLADLAFIVEYNPKLQFYDNLINKSSMSLNVNFKTLAQLYFHVSILKSLIYPSLCIQPESDSKQEEIKNLDYGNVSESNMENILHEASKLEDKISKMSLTEFDELLLDYAQIKFSTKACILFIYQTIYKQASLSPKTVMLVKTLKPLITSIFKMMESISGYELERTTLLILPIFCYGVDLIGNNNRANFINNLNRLYHIGKREMIKSAIDLLQIVWGNNPNGNNFVDWKYLSKQYKINSSLCC